MVILFIILLVFGSKKLPELARGLGKGINEFKRASQEIQNELDINTPPKQAPKSVPEKNTEDESKPKSE